VDVVTRIADAVLYEGYILWPYRKSALKNQRRFGFGTVYPPGGPERSFNQTACLLKGDEKATVEVTVRFLHKVDRQIWRGGEPIDEVEIGGELHQSWEEVVERELRLLVDMRSPARLPFEIAAGASREELGGGCVVVRGWHTLRGSVVARAQLVRPGLFGLRVRTENVTPGDPDDRERSGLRSAHTVLVARGGSFVSLTDPQGNVIAWASAGASGWKGSRKSTPYAAQVTAENAARKAMDQGLRTIEVFVRGPGAGREAAIRALEATGLEVTAITDVTPIPHNGCRAPKRRRV